MIVIKTIIKILTNIRKSQMQRKKICSNWHFSLRRMHLTPHTSYMVAHKYRTVVYVEISVVVIRYNLSCWLMT